MGYSFHGIFHVSCTRHDERAAGGPSDQHCTWYCSSWLHAAEMTLNIVHLPAYWWSYTATGSVWGSAHLGVMSRCHATRGGKFSCSLKMFSSSWPTRWTAANVLSRLVLGSNAGNGVVNGTCKKLNTVSLPFK